MAGVLIIDSEAAVAKELDDAFKARGVDTHLTADGGEALKLARRDKPDLIVLCVELSRGSGYSVCNKLKKDAELSSIPLILTSSQATEETFEQHKKLRTRAEAYLKKPYNTSEVVEIAGKYLAFEVTGRETDLEVSLDDVSIDSANGDESLFEVSVDDEADVSIEAGSEPMPGASERVGDSGFSAQATSVLVASAEAENLRAEIRQLRQKVKKLEGEAQERELQFNDRLLEESSRARDAVDLKKKLGQVEREINRYKQAAQKAEAAAKQAQQELSLSKREGDQAHKERELLSDKIGQLVDKVKSLAAERDEVHAQLQEALRAKSELEATAANAERVRAKARKAVDIAVQLIGETGL